MTEGCPNGLSVCHASSSLGFCWCRTVAYHPPYLYCVCSLYLCCNKQHREQKRKQVRLVVKKYSQTSRIPDLIWLNIGSANAGVAGPERQIVLFKLVNALAEQLRAVFVPYFRHLLGLVTTHLASSSGGKRKREHVPKPSSAEAYAGPDAPFLRLQVSSPMQQLIKRSQGER